MTACYVKEMELQHVTTVKGNLGRENIFSKVLLRGQQGGQEVNKINCYIAGLFPATARLFIG